MGKLMHKVRQNGRLRGDLYPEPGGMQGTRPHGTRPVLFLVARRAARALTHTFGLTLALVWVVWDLDKLIPYLLGLPHRARPSNHIAPSHLQPMQPPFPSITLAPL